MEGILDYTEFIAQFSVTVVCYYWMTIIHTMRNTEIAVILDLAYFMFLIILKLILYCYVIYLFRNSFFNIYVKKLF